MFERFKLGFAAGVLGGLLVLEHDDLGNAVVCLWLLIPQFADELFEFGLVCLL